MLWIVRKRLIPIVLSFVLLLGITVPFGSRSADASGSREAIKIAAGGSHSLALLADGSIVGWGMNMTGQLNVPETAQSEVAAIAAGGNHTLALLSDGSVIAWGNDASGQATVPEEAQSGVTAIAAGYAHSLALKEDGSVVAWGSGSYKASTVPEEAHDDVAAIAAGWFSSLALKKDGSVVAWGFEPKSLPKEAKNEIEAIAAGFNHFLALKGGRVIAWGSSEKDQLIVPAEAQNGVIAIAAGWNFSLALKGDGSVVAWGDNGRGQTNVPVEAQSGVVAIAAGDNHALALKEDGSVIAWGDNEYDQSIVPGNDSLDGLTMAEGSLRPVFSPSVTSYTSYIGPSVSSVNVTATVTDATYTALYINDQLQVSGSTATVNVPGASTVIPVRVKSNLRPSKSYTITVLKDSTPPVIQFSKNGRASSAYTAETMVTVTDAESGVDAASLKYAWTQSKSVPSDGWNSFASGDTLRKTSVDGNWYLHVRAADLTGNVADAVSKAFVFGNASPTSGGGSGGNSSSTGNESGSGNTTPIDENRNEKLLLDLLTRPAPDFSGNGPILDLLKSDLFNNVASYTLEVKPSEGDKVDVTLPEALLNGLVDKNAGFTIEIKTPYGSYLVPASLTSLIPGLNELLASNNLNSEEISFKITMTDMSDNKDVQTAFRNSFLQGEIMGAPVDFHLEIVNNKTGQSIGTVNTFSKAVTSMIPLPKGMTDVPEQWGAFRYNESTKQFEFVAARAKQIDGVWYAVISSYTNNLCIVAENSVTLTDMQEHWGQEVVQLAAAKGLVEGVGDGEYNPDGMVTRAEFAAMLVRALGTGTLAGGTLLYDDVQPGDWYFGAIAKAEELGLLDLADGNSFMPDQSLTREEMASMLAGVIKLQNPQLTGHSASLDGYNDIGSADEANLEDIRLMTGLQIMTGTGAGMFDPKGETTRAQAATVFIRTLRTLGWID